MFSLRHMGYFSLEIVEKMESQEVTYVTSPRLFSKTAAEWQSLVQTS